MCGRRRRQVLRWREDDASREAPRSAAKQRVIDLRGAAEGAQAAEHSAPWQQEQTVTDCPHYGGPGIKAVTVERGTAGSTVPGGGGAGRHRYEHRARQASSGAGQRRMGGCGRLTIPHRRYMLELWRRAGARRQSQSPLPPLPLPPSSCGVEPYSEAFHRNQAQMDGLISQLNAGACAGERGRTLLRAPSGALPKMISTCLPLLLLHLLPQTLITCCKRAAQRRCSGTGSAASCCRGACPGLVPSAAACRLCSRCTCSSLPAGQAHRQRRACCLPAGSAFSCF